MSDEGEKLEVTRGVIIYTTVLLVLVSTNEPTKPTPSHQPSGSAEFSRRPLRPRRPPRPLSQPTPSAPQSSRVSTIPPRSIASATAPSALNGSTRMSTPTESTFSPPSNTALPTAPAASSTGATASPYHFYAFCYIEPYYALLCIMTIHYYV